MRAVSCHGYLVPRRREWGTKRVGFDPFRLFWEPLLRHRYIPIIRFWSWRWSQHNRCHTKTNQQTYQLLDSSFRCYYWHFNFIFQIQGLIWLVHLIHSSSNTPEFSDYLRIVFNDFGFHGQFFENIINGKIRWKS